MKITDKNILELARSGEKAVLNHPCVDKVKDVYRWTPLHLLARSGCIEVLKHPSVDKVKDNWGRTPLHLLARSGEKAVLNHPSVDKVKNMFGSTPLHRLAMSGELYVRDLKSKYPWINYREDEEVTEEMITEILNTPNSIRFAAELLNENY